MLRHPRLPPKSVAVGIEAKGQPGGSDGPHKFLAPLAILDGNERMQVGNEEKRFVVRVAGKFDGGLNRPQNITQVRTTAALDAG